MLKKLSSVNDVSNCYFPVPDRKFGLLVAESLGL